ncbi:benzoate/H(+) symporter BenE family transporter [Paenibacillus montanisoli]|uniref:Benzoate transporter n=1 Tax=Paenibacillus montanisoli TaxID=2081970 RepID=A0A328U740_9BACL|nr:benzoate/H(+) symporter BenE family transporter [Paenibacillus montanisoli]RAP78537.1 benzoate transporter [Paenibacillus montanisoli]
MITAGFMSALLACTGGAILLVKAADEAGLAKSELVSWFASAYIIGGLLNLLLTLKYKIPFAGAHSITATAFLGTTALGLSFPELAGAFIMSGMIILLAGCSGLFAKAMNRIPKHLIDALLAGMLLSYVVKMVPAGISLPFSGILAGIGYFAIPVIEKKLPPTLWALIFGLIGLSLEFRFTSLPKSEFMTAWPVMPQFTVEGLFSVAIPMAVLVLSNDLAVALAALKSNQFEPPVNKVLAASGIATMLAGGFGGNAANVGGLMSALCSSPDSGSKDKRYWAAVLSSVMVMCYGILAWRVVDLITVMPSSFITLITGLSLLGLFINGLRSSLSNKGLLIPSLTTFTVAALHIHLLGIATPVWALLAGCIVMKAIHLGRMKRSHGEGPD